MLEDGVLARSFQRRDVEQADVIAEADRRARLLDGLGGAAGEAGDHHHRAVGPRLRRLANRAQHRLVQTGITDGELGGVDANGEAAGAGVEVVAGQHPLAAGVEAALGVERQRMRRNDDAAPDRREDVLGKLRTVQGHCFSPSADRLCDER